tara:strand:- start:50 stop:247 length:198 start_codon:yes stop_codon:yes gene_type:complete
MSKKMNSSEKKSELDSSVKLEDLKSHLFNLKLDIFLNLEKNKSLLKVHKKKIARFLTIRNSIKKD